MAGGQRHPEGLACGPKAVPGLHCPEWVEVELEPELPHVCDTLDERRGGPDPDGARGKVRDPVVRDVVIGHGGWFVGNDLSPAKEQLLLNTCNWLLGRDDRLTTEKGPLWKYPRATMSPRVQFLWLSGACIGLPLLFLYLGLMVLLVRRLR